MIDNIVSMPSAIQRKINAYKAAYSAYDALANEYDANHTGKEAFNLLVPLSVDEDADLESVAKRLAEGESCKGLITCPIWFEVFSLDQAISEIESHRKEELSKCSKVTKTNAPEMEEALLRKVQSASDRALKVSQMAWDALLSGPKMEPLHKAEAVMQEAIAKVDAAMIDIMAAPCEVAGDRAAKGAFMLEYQKEYGFTESELETLFSFMAKEAT